VAICISGLLSRMEELEDRTRREVFRIYFGIDEPRIKSISNML